MNPTPATPALQCTCTTPHRQNGDLNPPSLPPHSLPLRQLRISGLASERAVYQLSLPDQLTQLAATLQQLELPRCGLRALPGQVAALSGLTSLDLSCNSIVRLPSMR